MLPGLNITTQMGSRRQTDTVRGEKARDTELTADQNTTNLCNNTSRHCYNLVDSLTSSVAYQDLFSTKINLFPPSLVCFNQDAGGGGRKSLPALGKLKERSEKLLSDLDELNEKLSVLASSQSHYEELEPERVDAHRRTLRNTMGTLTQIIGTFGTCYTEDFKQWNDRPQIRLNDIGPLSKQLDHQLTKVLDLLDKVQGFNTNVEYIQSLEMNKDLGPVLTQRPLSKQLDHQLTKVLDLLDKVQGFNTNVEYIQSLEMNKDLGPVLTQRPLSKQLDHQLTKVLDLLDKVQGFNTNVEYIQSLEMNKDLGPVLTQTHSLTPVIPGDEVFSFCQP
eukprot:sb/3466608/